MKGKCNVFDGFEVKDLVLGAIDQEANDGENDAIHYYGEYKNPSDDKTGSLVVMDLESNVKLSVHDEEDLKYIAIF